MKLVKVRADRILAGVSTAYSERYRKKLNAVLHFSLNEKNDEEMREVYACIQVYCNEWDRNCRTLGLKAAQGSRASDLHAMSVDHEWCDRHHA